MARAPKPNSTIEAGSGTGSVEPPPDLSVVRRYCKSALLKFVSPFTSPMIWQIGQPTFPSAPVQ